jgi:hypothetical protein
MDPYGIAIFCDDIREETGGKISLVGCYGPDMRFEGVPFPLVYPKIGIYVTARLPFSATPPIRILVYFPGDSEEAPTMTVDMPLPEEFKTEPDIVRYPPDPLMPRDSKRQHGFRRHFVLSPVIIAQEGFIRVRMMYGDQRIPLGALRIRNVPASEAAPAASPA